MTKLSARITPRYNHALLREIRTPLGMRAFYDSIAFCNRCGCCRQSCPSYRIFLQEPFSPRGRNQFVRLIMEGKLNLSATDKQIRRITDSCSLCGKCSASCAGQIPTAEHILQIRRALNQRVLPFTLHYLMRMHRKSPKLFKFILKIGMTARNVGLIKLLRALPLLPAWIKHADDILPRKISLLSTALNKEGNLSQETKIYSLIYLPSFEVSFFAPQTALDILRRLKGKHTPFVWQETPSGLFSYVYENDVRLARMQVRRLIKRHAHTANGRLPLLTDSIDVYLFLKNAAQFFPAGSAAQKRAEVFADSVRFITDYFPPKKQKLSAPVMLDTSALLWRPHAIFDKTSKILIDVFGKNFVECEYTGLSIATGGYPFINTPLALEMGLLCVRRYAQGQIDNVVTLSVLTQLEMTFLLSKFYPHAKPHYLMQLAE